MGVGGAGEHRTVTGHLFHHLRVKWVQVQVLSFPLLVFWLLSRGKGTSRAEEQWQLEGGPSEGLGRREARQAAWGLDSRSLRAARAPAQCLPVCALGMGREVSLLGAAASESSSKKHRRGRFPSENLVSFCLGLCSAEMCICPPPQGLRGPGHLCQARPCCPHSGLGLHWTAAGTDCTFSQLRRSKWRGTFRNPSTSSGI